MFATTAISNSFPRGTGLRETYACGLTTVAGARIPDCALAGAQANRQAAVSNPAVDNRILRVTFFENQRELECIFSSSNRGTFSISTIRSAPNILEVLRAHRS